MTDEITRIDTTMSEKSFCLALRCHDISHAPSTLAAYNHAHAKHQALLDAEQAEQDAQVEALAIQEAEAEAARVANTPRGMFKSRIAAIVTAAGFGHRASKKHQQKEGGEEDGAVQGEEMDEKTTNEQQEEEEVEVMVVTPRDMTDVEQQIRASAVTTNSSSSTTTTTTTSTTTKVKASSSTTATATATATESSSTVVESGSTRPTTLVSSHVEKSSEASTTSATSTTTTTVKKNNDGTTTTITTTAAGGKHVVTKSSDNKIPTTKTTAGMTGQPMAYVEQLTDVARDIQYYAEVEIGSNQQRFRLDLDTGSSDLWVPDISCKTDAAKFNSKKSTTFVPMTGKFKIRYGDGSFVSGVFGSDTVNLAGLEIKHQTFALATEQSIGFKNDKVDGLLGLGYNSISSIPGTKTPMDNLIEQGLIQNPLFGVWLGRHGEGGGGEYMFGDYNRERFFGELTWLPVTKRRYWQVAVDGLWFKDLDLKQKGEVIIDTGTTLCIVPTKVAKAIHAQIPGAIWDKDHGWMIPDNETVRSLPGFGLLMGGQKFEIVIKDILREDVPGKDGFVYSGIGSSDFIPVWILGDVFIKENYCVFDQGQHRIGIAKFKPLPPKPAMDRLEEQTQKMMKSGKCCTIM